MEQNVLQTYLSAQSELGGFEVVLSVALKTKNKTAQPVNKQIQQVRPIINKPVAPPKPLPNISEAELKAKQEEEAKNDLLWKNATDINNFYDALSKHSIYTKSMRSLSYYDFKDIKINTPLLLIFHSPKELTNNAKDILNRLFKKINIDLNTCAISFFFKCNETAMPRERIVLKDMLHKEISFLNPEKIVFFREAPRLEQEDLPKISAIPITFANKPAITLYSLLEMLPGKANVKEKMIEVLNICKNNLQDV